MNAPVVAGAVIVGWFALAAEEPALVAIAGILFALALLWAVLVTHDSWRVLLRFTRIHAPRV
jgi:hypothetical protein